MVYIELCVRYRMCQHIFMMQPQETLLCICTNFSGTIALVSVSESMLSNSRLMLSVVHLGKVLPKVPVKHRSEGVACSSCWN